MIRILTLLLRAANGAAAALERVFYWEEPPPPPEPFDRGDRVLLAHAGEIGYVVRRHPSDDDIYIVELEGGDTVPALREDLTLIWINETLVDRP